MVWGCLFCICISLLSFISLCKSLSLSLALAPSHSLFLLSPSHLSQVGASQGMWLPQKQSKDSSRTFRDCYEEIFRLVSVCFSLSMSLSPSLSLSLSPSLSLSFSLSLPLPLSLSLSLSISLSLSPLSPSLPSCHSYVPFPFSLSSTSSPFPSFSRHGSIDRTQVISEEDLSNIRNAGVRALSHSVDVQSAAFKYLKPLFDEMETYMERRGEREAHNLKETLKKHPQLAIYIEKIDIVREREDKGRVAKRVEEKENSKQHRLKLQYPPPDNLYQAFVPYPLYEKKGGGGRVSGSGSKKEREMCGKENSSLQDVLEEYVIDHEGTLSMTHLLIDSYLVCILTCAASLSVSEALDEHESYSTAMGYAGRVGR